MAAEEIQVVGLENKCMAKCYQRGTKEVIILEQDFLFCERHASVYGPAVEAYEEDRMRTALPVGAPV